MDNIINVNINNKNLKFKNGKSKIVNIMHIKPCCQDLKIHLFENASCSSKSAPHFSQDISQPSQEPAQELPHRPLTRVWKSLLFQKCWHYGNSFNVRCNLRLPGIIFEENYDTYNYINCYGSINRFSHGTNSKDLFQNLTQGDDIAKQLYTFNIQHKFGNTAKHEAWININNKFP